MVTTDDQNPDYLFQLAHPRLLAAIARGDLDAVALARREMANRGLGQSGQWVGFDAADAEWFPCYCGNRGHLRHSDENASCPRTGAVR